MHQSEVGLDQGSYLYTVQSIISIMWLVLELGTYTGFSAVAWYDGTRANKAEIVTLDNRKDVLERTRAFIKQLGVDDRITSIAGPAAETLVQISQRAMGPHSSSSRFETLVDDSVGSKRSKANSILYFSMQTSKIMGGIWISTWNSDSCPPKA